MTSPRHVLIVPDAAAGEPARQPLTFTTDHVLSSYGLGVLLDPEGDPLSGVMFRSLRDSFGARIETDQPEKCCRALGLPVGEPGIGRPEGGGQNDD